jgi:hypothetical protein
LAEPELQNFCVVPKVTQEPLPCSVCAVISPAFRPPSAVIGLNVEPVG